MAGYALYKLFNDVKINDQQEPSVTADFGYYYDNYKSLLHTNIDCVAHVY